MVKDKENTVRKRQDGLRMTYSEKPDHAVITDQAKTIGGADSDPFHGTVVLGSAKHFVNVPYGIHSAVGGYHDAPNPGDMLCGAIAACLDSTIRIIAERLGVEIESLEVKVTAKVDVRGTLLIDREVPVGFQSIKCAVNLIPHEGTSPLMVQKMVAAAEHSCVNIATLNSKVSIETSVNESRGADSAPAIGAI